MTKAKTLLTTAAALAAIDQALSLMEAVQGNGLTKTLFPPTYRRALVALTTAAAAAAKALAAAKGRTGKGDRPAIAGGRNDGKGGFGRSLKPNSPRGRRAHNSGAKRRRARRLPAPAIATG